MKKKRFHARYCRLPTDLRRKVYIPFRRKRKVKSQKKEGILDKTTKIYKKVKNPRYADSQLLCRWGFTDKTIENFSL